MALQKCLIEKNAEEVTGETDEFLRATAYML